MTKNEAAIITAYTGYLIGSFSDFHGYAEKILERPIFTHEFGSEKISKEIKDKSTPDFVGLNKAID